MENAEIASVFEEIADLLELQEANEFRIRSYRSAAHTVRDHAERVEDLVAQGKDLTALPEVGDSIAEKIEILVEEGELEQLQQLREEIPPDVTTLMRVPQVGPKLARQLYDELGITSLDELQNACDSNVLQELHGLGAKTEETIREGLQTLRKTSERFYYHTAAEHVNTVERWLKQLDEVQHGSVAGSFRRRKETVGDLDILLLCRD